MAKKKALEELDKLRAVAIGGGLTIKSTDVIAHARSPGGLTADIGGLIGVGIAGATSKVAMDMATGKYRKRKMKKIRVEYLGKT